MKCDCSWDTLHTYLPMRTEQKEYSETLVLKLHAPGNNPEDSIWHSIHGDSFKSRTITVIYWTKTDTNIKTLCKLFYNFAYQQCSCVTYRTVYTDFFIFIHYIYSKMLLNGIVVYKYKTEGTSLAAYSNQIHCITMCLPQSLLVTLVSLILRSHFCLM
jgi:hypothetical protein